MYLLNRLLYLLNSLNKTQKKYCNMEKNTGKVSPKLWETCTKYHVQLMCSTKLTTYALTVWYAPQVTLFYYWNINILKAKMPFIRRPASGLPIESKTLTIWLWNDHDLRHVKTKLNWCPGSQISIFQFLTSTQWSGQDTTIPKTKFLCQLIQKWPKTHRHTTKTLPTRMHRR